MQYKNKYDKIAHKGEYAELTRTVKKLHSAQQTRIDDGSKHLENNLGSWRTEALTTAPVLSL